MRVAVVDIGTNSTRLLVADVGEDGTIVEIERRTQVTRLGEGVDEARTLSDVAIRRVLAALEHYDMAIEGLGADARIAVLTSAVRDSANGDALAETVRERYQLEATVLTGDEEAQLTFLGAMSDQDPSDSAPTLVIDAGGGSTELIVGNGQAVDFHVSLQAGVVRQSERYLHSDPPSMAELRALGRDVRSLIERDVPPAMRRTPSRAIAVGGTATSLAAIDQELAPYDPARVHGYRLELTTVRLLLARLASMPLSERREVRGLHPDRAPTILAGIAILIEVLEAFGLAGFEASEHDILRGAALERARVA
ncbi:MAG: Ppx/GppA family phosphatase [Solirubrobacteraceae bacterium]|jgi:exopolyphosphatase/guanosine-5'-triphosphate,3'-diphosphate pyrophosphatase